jgi:hypothetical protein
MRRTPDRPAPTRDRRQGALVELFSPRSEAELLLLRSVLGDAGIYLFVKNDAFGSLAVGPQIEHYNRKTIYVRPEEAEEARALLSEFLDKTALGDPAPGGDLRLGDVLRMVAEVLVFGWFMPGRRRRPPPSPKLRVIRGGRAGRSAPGDDPPTAPPAD